ncbi:MAG: hypothetical protein O7F71_00925 [Gammaproteobacteria bacterium]|nr:hypothetical protein [Gammaproteobacteria bacterium]
MGESVLRYEEKEHVGVITLTRPEAMNSLTYHHYRCPALSAEIQKLLKIQQNN